VARHAIGFTEGHHCGTKITLVGLANVRMEPTRHAVRNIFVILTRKRPLDSVDLRQCRHDDFVGAVLILALKIRVFDLRWRTVL